VSLGEFATWALKMGWEIPDALSRAAGDDPTMKKHTWPWGEHETKLLRILAGAAQRFWKRYDPSDETTAPTNEEVKAWIKQQGVSDRIAEAMATILRADNLHLGPRSMKE